MMIESKQDLHILFVDDEEITITAISRMLKNESYTRHFARNGREAWEIITNNPINILVTDMNMPEMDGLQLVKLVKYNYPEIVRMVFSAYSETTQLLPCINSGEIFRFITKPLDIRELRSRISEAVEYFLTQHDNRIMLDDLQKSNNWLQMLLADYQSAKEHLKRLAIKDELTGLYDKRLLRTALHYECDTAKNFGINFSALMVSVDNCLSYTDSYGASCGEYIQQLLAGRIKDQLRDRDLPFRYDDNLALLLLPHTKVDEAKKIGTSILEACRLEPFATEYGPLNLTASAGVIASSNMSNLIPDNIITSLESALCEAQKSGGNRMVVCPAALM